MSLLPFDLLSFLWGALVGRFAAFGSGFLKKAGEHAFSGWRVTVVFSLETGSWPSEAVEESAETGDVFEDDPHDTVNVTITNLGARMVMLDLRTLTLKHANRTLSVWYEDHWGKGQRELLLKPQDSKTMGIPYSTFTQTLRVEQVADLHHEFALKIQVKSIEGKTFCDGNLRFWAATGEFRRVRWRDRCAELVRYDRRRSLHLMPRHEPTTETAAERAEKWRL